ncbi:hypothetical protein D3C85_1690060 [compost metagenome]
MLLPVSQETVGEFALVMIEGRGRYWLVADGGAEGFEENAEYDVHLIKSFFKCLEVGEAVGFEC